MQQVQKSVFDGFQKSRLSYYGLLPKDNNRTLNDREGLNNPLTISLALCFITFLGMITFAGAGCVVLTRGLQLCRDVRMCIAYRFPECQLRPHSAHTTGENNVSPLYRSVINSQKSFGLDNLKIKKALKPFLCFLKQQTCRADVVVLCLMSCVLRCIPAPHHWENTHFIPLPCAQQRNGAAKPLLYAKRLVGQWHMDADFCVRGCFLCNKSQVFADRPDWVLLTDDN